MTSREQPMPIYTFKLRDGSGDVEDANGIELRDQGVAVRYAHDVVYELMKSREQETRSWSLEVYEHGGDSPICEISFASVDPSLDHLTPTLRRMVEDGYGRRRLLSDVIHNVKGTIQKARALVARARGKPYLASRFGKAIIRDT
jgi:hypothetical protein